MKGVLSNRSSIAVVDPMVCLVSRASFAGVETPIINKWLRQFPSVMFIPSYFANAFRINTELLLLPRETVITCKSRCLFFSVITHLDINLDIRHDMIFVHSSSSVTDIQASLIVMIDSSAEVVQQINDVGNGLLVAQVVAIDGKFLGLRQQS